MSVFKDFAYEDFQLSVENSLPENSSILDILSKLGRSSARTERAVICAATCCGCISLSSKNGPEGKLCEKCRRAIEQELGDLLLYSAAVSSKLGISLLDVVINENRNLSLLGKFLYL